MRARARRHADAPAGPHVRRRLRPRRDRVHDEPRTTSAIASARHTRTRGPAAWRSSCPTSRARRSRPAPRTAATTARTGARSVTSSGRSTTTRATRRTRSTTRSSCASRARRPRVVHDHHVEGVFPEHTWLYLLEQAGFEPSVDRAAPDRRRDVAGRVPRTPACLRPDGVPARSDLARDPTGDRQRLCPGDRPRAGPTSSSRMAARTLA